MDGQNAAEAVAYPKDGHWPAAVLARLRDWFLLDANRYGLAFGMLAVGFVLFVWLEVTGIIDVGRSTTPMLYLFSALAGGNITLITIVVSINQLILSRELRSPRELQTEMEAATDFRDDVEAETEGLVVPEEPEEFLLMLARNTHRHLAGLEEAIGDLDRCDASTDLAVLIENLRTELDETIERLDRSRGGVFTALSTPTSRLASITAGGSGERTTLPSPRRRRTTSRGWRSAWSSSTSPASTTRPSTSNRNWPASRRW